MKYGRGLLLWQKKQEITLDGSLYSNTNLQASTGYRWFSQVMDLCLLPHLQGISERQSWKMSMDFSEQQKSVVLPPLYLNTNDIFLVVHARHNYWLW